METSKTFATVEAASAFMMGFHLASSETICARIDDEEPISVNIDTNDDEDDGIYFEGIAEFRENMEKHGAYDEMDFIAYMGSALESMGHNTFMFRLSEYLKNYATRNKLAEDDKTCLENAARYLRDSITE